MAPTSRSCASWRRAQAQAVRDQLGAAQPDLDLAVGGQGLSGLRIAEEHDFIIVEDDIYCDMHPGSAVQPATRIAALDQLQRVIYLGGFSKTLSANLRVGFIATSAELARSLADRKLLSTLTTGEIGERVAYKVLSEGHYRKHAERCARGSTARATR
jgi:DNA-binding transcriptional MocR family regulator